MREPFFGHGFLPLAGLLFLVSGCLADLPPACTQSPPGVLTHLLPVLDVAVRPPPPARPVLNLLALRRGAPLDDLRERDLDFAFG